MNESPALSGEAIERAARRRRVVIVTVLCALGGAIGGTIGAQQGDHLFELASPWPPALALAAAGIFLLAVAVASLVLKRDLDEVERLMRLRAVHAGGTVFLVVYPVWFLLWKGGFVPEPMHVALFVVTAASMLLAKLYYRVR